MWDKLLLTCNFKRFSSKTPDGRSNEAVWFGSRFTPSLPPPVTRLWKAYLLSSGLLSPLSEVIRAELSLCSRLSLLHRPHGPDGGPPPAESLKEHSLWSSVVYKCSRGISQCLEKIVILGTHSERDWNSYYCGCLICWGGDPYITLFLWENLSIEHLNSNANEYIQIISTGQFTLHLDHLYTWQKKLPWGTGGCFTSALILLQGKTTMETLVKKERERWLHLSWTHRKHPSYATASCISQTAQWLVLDLCHMWICISPLTAGGQCHPFQFFIGSCPVV